MFFLVGLPMAWGNQLLPGHRPGVVAHLTAKGVLPATNRLTLAIGLPLHDAAGLDDYLDRLYNPASPDYRHYLTPAQFTEQFGPTETDYQSVVAFAQWHHLIVAHTHANRLLLDVTGSVADVQAAFHVTLRVYRHPTEARDFYAPDTEPSVDDGLPIADISGLDNYTRPHPRSLRIDPAQALARATPRTGSGASGTYFGGDFRAAYLPGVTLTGAGQELGLVEFDGYYASDIAAYEAKAKQAAVPLQNVLLDGFDGTPVDPNANIEVSLDIEMAIAMAPGLSKIVVFEDDPNVYQPNDVLSSIAENAQISQISSSWGWGNGPSITTDNLFKKLAAQGQSFFNASGDSDAFTTGANSANGVDNTSLANAPSSSPYITQVGGTTLTTTGPGGSWSAEKAWNWGLDQGSYVGTSGGISSYYAIPTWQAKVNMSANGGSTTYRNIPDVALTADNVRVYFGNGTNGSVGGTSCAAPLWTGLAALINEQAVAAGRSTVGFVNPAIYALGENSGYAASFHDVTTGNNFWPSSPGEFNAVSGYDLCTGWGTPEGQSLINAIAGPPDPLGVSPVTGFTAAGLVGGPFSPASQTFTLTNSGATALNWSISEIPAWLTVTPTSGSLAVDQSTTVTVGLNASASVLPAGDYTSSLAINDLTAAVSQSSQVTLQVGQSVVQNGGFETGAFTDWTLAGNGVTGNTVYNAVESVTTYSDVVHAGTYGAFLGDTSLATLSQTLATVPGQNYFLSVWLDNSIGGTGQVFEVNWNTNTAGINQIYYVTNPPVFGWTNLQFVVAATGTHTVLQFGAANPPNYFGLDDISATPLPAPSVMAASQTANSLSLTWYAVAGLNYQVLYSTNLVNWIPLSTNLAAAATLSFTTAVGTDHQRFFRIRQLP
jgi:hypothetical protein